VDVAVQWLRTNPKWRNEIASVLLAMAYLDAYPCKEE
jgi:hypothetical protein